MNYKFLALALVGTAAVSAFAGPTVHYLPGSPAAKYQLFLTWQKNNKTVTVPIDDVSYIDLVQPGGQQTINGETTQFPGSLTFVMCEQDHNWWSLASAAHRANTKVSLLIKFKFCDTVPIVPEPAAHNNEGPPLIDVGSLEQSNCAVIKLCDITDISIVGAKNKWACREGFPGWYCYDRDNPTVYTVSYNTLSFPTP